MKGEVYCNYGPYAVIKVENDLFEMYVGEDREHVLGIGNSPEALARTFGIDRYYVGDYMRSPDPSQLAGKMEDGGERVEYSNGGALREPSTGKGRYDLISPYATQRVYISSQCEELSDSDSVVGIFRNVSAYCMSLRGKDHLALAARYAFRLLDKETDSGLPDPKTQIIPGWLYPHSYERLAKWYELGSIKYGDRNWEKGIPYSRCIDSCLRHLTRWSAGSLTEDHLAAIVWNLFAIMHYEDLRMTQFDDMPKYGKKEEINKDV